MAKIYFKLSVLFSYLGALIYFGSVNTLIIIFKDFEENFYHMTTSGRSQHFVASS